MLGIPPDLDLYYNPQPIANLISISSVTSKYCFTMDSKVEYEISMHLGRHKNIKFTWCENGVYYFDTAKIGHVKTPQDDITDDDKTDKSKI